METGFPKPVPGFPLSQDLGRDRFSVGSRSPDPWRNGRGRGCRSSCDDAESVGSGTTDAEGRRRVPSVGGYGVFCLGPSPHLPWSLTTLPEVPPVYVFPRSQRGWGRVSVKREPKMGGDTA